jgi:hypothetical protein
LDVAHFEELFNELRKDELTVSYAQFRKYDEIEAMITDGALQEEDLQKMWYVL